MLHYIAERSAHYGLPVANVFHAGDGNLHPLILFDANLPGALQTAEQLGAEILEKCIEEGGTITGEHGVGIGKRKYMAAEHGSSLPWMQRLKSLFDPNGILNPGKIFPDGLDRFDG